MSALERIWWREEEAPLDRLLLSPLLLAAAAFRLAAAARGALYDRGVLRPERAGAPVVSVGNLSVGGAGKTPAAISLGRRLAAAGRRVALLSRGYGAVRRDARLVSDGRSLLLGAAEGGDEPVLCARRLPGAIVLAGPRRAELARRAVALGADALLLDDGFQHRALHRDLDVVVLDASNPFGNGHALPRGPAREPRRALRRAHLCWLSRVDQAGRGRLAELRDLARRLTGREPVESRHAPVGLLDAALSRSFDLAALRGGRVALLSGVARPEGFRRTVESLGAEVAVVRAYRDHHRFADRELAEVIEAADRHGCDWVVTTEKDAVRLTAGQAGAERLRALRVEAEVVAGERTLDDLLGEALGRRPASPAGGLRG